MNSVLDHILASMTQLEVFICNKIKRFDCLNTYRKDEYWNSAFLYIVLLVISNSILAWCLCLDIICDVGNILSFSETVLGLKPFMLEFMTRYPEITNETVYESYRLSKICKHKIKSAVKVWSEIKIIVMLSSQKISIATMITILIRINWIYMQIND